MNMTVDGDVTIRLPGQVTMQVPRSVGVTIVDELQAQLAGTSSGGEQPLAAVFPDDHPSWERTSNSYGAGLEGWDTAAERDAELLYLAIVDKAKTRRLVDLFIDHGGQQLTTDDIIAMAPDAFASSRAIAGSINGLRLPVEEAQRRYPFHWWEGKGTPSRYGMQQGVAAKFARARANVAGKQ